jgi:hypothetical protein
VHNRGQSLSRQGTNTRHELITTDRSIISEDIHEPLTRLRIPLFPLWDFEIPGSLLYQASCRLNNTRQSSTQGTQTICRKATA